MREVDPLTQIINISKTAETSAHSNTAPAFLKGDV